MLPGNDMKFPTIVADDNTFVMRLEVLPTPGVQPVPIVPPGPGGETVVVRTSQSQFGQLHSTSIGKVPPKALPYLEAIHMTKSMTKFLCQKTEWIDNKNVKMYYPPALSFNEHYDSRGRGKFMTEDECEDLEPAHSVKISMMKVRSSSGREQCSKSSSGQDNNHVQLHASALSLNQPCNTLGDGPKRRASKTDPRSKDRMNIDIAKGLVELDKSHIVQVATCSFPPVVIQDGKLVERPQVLWDRDRLWLNKYGSSYEPLMYEQVWELVIGFGTESSLFDMATVNKVTGEACKPALQCLKWKRKCAAVNKMRKVCERELNYVYMHTITRMLLPFERWKQCTLWKRYNAGGGAFL